MKMIIESRGQEEVGELFPKEKRWGGVVVVFTYSSSTKKQLFLLFFDN